MKFSKLLLIVCSVVAVSKATPIPLFEGLFGDDYNHEDSFDNYNSDGFKGLGGGYDHENDNYKSSNNNRDTDSFGGLFGGSDDYNRNDSYDNYDDNKYGGLFDENDDYESSFGKSNKNSNDYGSSYGDSFDNYDNEDDGNLFDIFNKPSGGRKNNNSEPPSIPSTPPTPPTPPSSSGNPYDDDSSMNVPSNGPASSPETGYPPADDDFGFGNDYEDEDDGNLFDIFNKPNGGKANNNSEPPSIPSTPLTPPSSSDSPYDDDSSMNVPSNGPASSPETGYPPADDDFGFGNDYEDEDDGNLFDIFNKPNGGKANNNSEPPSIPSTPSTPPTPPSSSDSPYDDDSSMNVPSNGPASSPETGKTSTDSGLDIDLNNIPKDADIASLVTNGISNLIKNNLCASLGNGANDLCESISTTIINSISGILKGVIKASINTATGNTLTIACSIIPSEIFRKLSSVVVNAISSQIGKSGDGNSENINNIANNVLTVIINSVENLLCDGVSTNGAGDAIINDVSSFINKITNKSKYMNTDVANGISNVQNAIKMEYKGQSQY